MVSTPAQVHPLALFPRMRKSSPKGWGVGGEAGEW